MYGVISLCFPFCQKEMYSLCHFLIALMLSGKKKIQIGSTMSNESTIYRQ
jgi:hypothetical protein